MALPLLFSGGPIVLRDRILHDGGVLVAEGRIVAVDVCSSITAVDVQRIDLGSNYLAPGFVDIHVHGGDGADFMDGSADAFRTVCRAHARHGTTSLLPTTTVARHDQLLASLELCRKLKSADTGGARILGAHFYGPFFAPEAKGCHPGAALHVPTTEEIDEYLSFADCIATATIAPEVPTSEAFAKACRERGIRVNVGHSHGTFEQTAAAVGWGARHVDHLFCAMSDRARLRLSQAYPMRGGVMEATLFFEELTTEVIADGRHLAPELLRLAFKLKGPDRLALVTDCSRALDLPDGDYLFGPLDGGEPFRKQDGVGIIPSGGGLASSVVGMDHCVRQMHTTAGVSLVETIRIASLTPATIAGFEDEVGSIAVGKRADLLILDADLAVRQVWIGGVCQPG